MQEMKQFGRESFAFCRTLDFFFFEKSETFLKNLRLTLIDLGGGKSCYFFKKKIFFYFFFYFLVLLLFLLSS